MFVNRWLSTLSILLALASVATAQERALLKRATSPFASMQPSEVSVNDSYTTGTELTVPGTASTKLGRIALGDGSGGHDWNDADAFAGRLGADDTATSASMPAFDTVQAGLDAVREIYSVEPAGGELRIGGAARIDGEWNGLSFTPLGEPVDADAVTAITVDAITPAETPSTGWYFWKSCESDIGGDCSVTWSLYPYKEYGGVLYFYGDPAVVSHTFSDSDFGAYDYATVSLSWGEVDGADGYVVRRSPNWDLINDEDQFRISDIGTLTSLVDSGAIAEDSTYGVEWVDYFPLFTTVSGNVVYNKIRDFRLFAGNELIRNSDSLTYYLGNQGTLAVTADIPDLSSPPPIGDVTPNAADFTEIELIKWASTDLYPFVTIKNTNTNLPDNTSSIQWVNPTSTGGTWWSGRISLVPRSLTPGTLEAAMGFHITGSTGGSFVYTMPMKLDGKYGSVSIRSGLTNIHTTPYGRVHLMTSGVGDTDRFAEFPDKDITVAGISDLPVGANPSATVNGTAVNGSATTWMRSDAAPALADPFTPSDGTQNVTGALTTSGALTSTTLTTGAGTLAAPAIQLGNANTAIYNSGGSIVFVGGGADRYKANKTAFYQSAGTPAQSLGQSSNRWLKTWSVSGDYSGALDVGTNLDVNGTADIAGSTYLGGSGNVAYIDGTLAILKDSTRHYFGRGTSDGIDIRSEVGYIRAGSSWIARWTRVSSSTAEWARNFAPYADGEPYLGTTTLRWASVNSYDGNFADDVVISDALTVSGASTMNSISATGTVTSASGYQVDGTDRIDGDGFFRPKSSADASAPNNSTYYSTDASALVYKDSGGTVHALY